MPKHGLFSIGDSVLVHNNNFENAQIIGFKPNDLTRVEVSYTDEPNNTSRTKKVSEKNVFIALKEYKGIELLKRTSEGLIVGFGIDKMLVKTTDGYQTINYPKINEE